MRILKSAPQSAAVCFVIGAAFAVSTGRIQDMRLDENIQRCINYGVNNRDMASAILHISGDSPRLFLNEGQIQDGFVKVNLESLSTIAVSENQAIQHDCREDPEAGLARSQKTFQFLRASMAIKAIDPN